MKAQQIYRVAAASVGWFALVLQYDLSLHKPGAELLPATINFFSYFTILTNILATLALTLPWLAPNSRIGQVFGRPSVRTAILAYIIVVAVIYHLLLRHLWHPEGWQKVADVIEHYIMPTLYLIDWLAFVPKGTLTLRSALSWLIFSFAYGGYAALRGAISGAYPYPFLDVAEIGYDRVFLNMGGLVLAFAMLGVGLVGLDRLLGSRR